MNAPTKAAYLQDQQSSAVAEIIALLPKIKAASAVQDILLGMNKTLEAQSYLEDDEMEICAKACAMAHEEIREQLEVVIVSDAQTILDNKRDCPRKEWR